MDVNWFVLSNSPAFSLASFYTTAMASQPDSRHHLHELINQLNDHQLPQAVQALESIRQDSLAAILRDLPGLRMPDHWPPRYPDVEPLTVPGEPASEQLIRERR